MVTEADEDAWSYQRVYRDGAMHVLAERCATCIFRPGNLMHLRPGQVKGMVDGAIAAQSCIPCHATLGPTPAICRGFYDAHADRVQPLQLADRLGVIRYQPAPTKEPA